MNTIGRNIRRYRRAAGYTQWEFSQRVGISPAALLLIERGQVACPAGLLEAIAAALGVDVAALTAK